MSAQRARCLFCTILIEALRHSISAEPIGDPPLYGPAAGPGFEGRMASGRRRVFDPRIPERKSLGIQAGPHFLGGRTHAEMPPPIAPHPALNRHGKTKKHNSHHPARGKCPALENQGRLFARGREEAGRDRRPHETYGRGRHPDGGMPGCGGRLRSESLDLRPGAHAGAERLDLLDRLSDAGVCPHPRVLRDLTSSDGGPGVIDGSQGSRPPRH